MVILKKEIAVICSHYAIDGKNGYLESMKMYYELSKNYDINIIVPRWEMYSFDSKINISPNITLQSICLEKYIPMHINEWVLGYIDRISLDETLKRKLRNIANDAEIIICDSIYYVSFAKSVFPDKFVIYRCLDIEYDKAKWFLKQSEEARKFSCMIDEAFNFEKKACENADRIICLTQNDYERLNKLYHINEDRFRIIPICCTDYSLAYNYIPQKKKSDDNKKVLLISSAPMEEADNFISITKKLSDIQFHIIGKSGYDLKNIPSNVIVHGVVSNEEKKQIASKCDVALNITSMTFGMNVKIMEYFTLGIPVISNELGVRGYDVTSYEEYFPGGVETLENDIRTFFKMSCNERYEMALKAFNYVCYKFRYANYIHIIDECIDKNEEPTYFIFGAGNIGCKALKYLEDNNFHCEGFIDNNITLHNKLYYGINIYSPTEAFEQIKNEKEQNILIAVGTNNIREIIQQVIAEIDIKKICLFINQEIIELNKSMF